MATPRNPSMSGRKPPCKMSQDGAVRRSPPKASAAARIPGHPTERVLRERGVLTGTGVGEEPQTRPRCPGPAVAIVALAGGAAASATGEARVRREVRHRILEGWPGAATRGL